LNCYFLEIQKKITSPTSLHTHPYQQEMSLHLPTHFRCQSLLLSETHIPFCRRAVLWAVDETTMAMSSCFLFPLPPHLPFPCKTLTHLTRTVTPTADLIQHTPLHRRALPTTVSGLSLLHRHSDCQAHRHHTITRIQGRCSDLTCAQDQTLLERNTYRSLTIHFAGGAYKTNR
jgi:hypothetical protein